MRVRVELLQVPRVPVHEFLLRPHGAPHDPNQRKRKNKTEKGSDTPREDVDTKLDVICHGPRVSDRPHR